jgi:SAM-dependent methyltransferase
MADTLEQLVGRLARRDDPRTEATVQADVRQLLLTAPLNLDAHQVVTLEAQVGDRRRIDVEVGATVIEVKKDLRTGSVLVEAVEQLKGYVETRQKTSGGRYVGVLTDGAEWRCYHLERGHLCEVAALTLSPTKPDVAALLVWVEGVLATARDIKPTPEAIQSRLGAGSSAHALDRATLAALYAEHRDAATVRTKRALWARLLATALGTQFRDDDALFVEHTLLVNSAEVIAHAVLGLPIESIAPASLLNGARFDERGIYGVVEADFFDWVVELPGGDAFVRTLARRLARFDWSAVDRDVLKVLYESVITAETRKQLGEYYTPDWLAQQVVEATVTAPCAQRVLDPSCGSGTFLFHAVRRYLAAADAAGIAPADSLAGVTRHVLGMDLHPVAVTFARVTYVLAIGRERLAVEGRGVLHVPVYLGDSMLWGRKPKDLLSSTELTIVADDSVVAGPPDPLIPTQLSLGGDAFQQTFRFPNALLKDAQVFDRLVNALAKRAASRKPNTAPPSLKVVFQQLGIAESAHATVTATFQTMCRLHDEGRDHIWGYYIRNMARPEWLSRPENHVDVLVGNPPWLAYQFMPAKMQARFRELCEARGLWHGGKVAPQQDLSSLFIARVMQLFLKPGGRFGFVMPDAVLDRGQYAGFRAGRFGEVNAPVFAAFTTPWDLRKVRPHFFPREAAVVFGQRGAAEVPMPAEVEAWRGRLSARGSTWETVRGSLQRQVQRTETYADQEGSPYRSRFRQGATIVPRVLFMVEKLPAGPLGMPAGQCLVRSTRSTTEKAPWKSLDRLEGVLETEFLRPVHLGETVLPYRALDPKLAVIPCEAEAVLDPQGEEMDQYPGLAAWWRDANALWEKHRATDKLTLTQQLDYHGKLTSQFPIAPQRVVYAKSGMHLAAARVVDHRAVFDHTLYWAAVHSTEEAHYLCAVLNSVAATLAVRPLLPRGKEERHIDSYVWKLPIADFDEADPQHVALAALGAEAEALVKTLPVKAGDNFVTLRRATRKLLEESDVGRRIEAIVAQMLPPPFLEEVYALVAEGQSRKAVSRVFAELDALLLEGDFSACGWMLAAVDVARLDPTTALAFLAISLPAHARLPARADLVARVEAMLQAHDPDRAARLLEGLRG